MLFQILVQSGIPNWTFSLEGIGSPDRPPSKQCGGWWVVGRGWWVKKKLVGRKILSVVKLVGEIWWVVGGGSCSPFWPNSYQDI